MRSKMRVGVVGVGAMGQHHVRIYSQMGCRLAGVADSDRVRGERIAAQYETEYFEDYRSLISRTDAVSIAVPTAAHHRVAMEFLSQGVHCLVEKPIAATLEEAEKMIAAAKSGNASLAIGHIERFNPAVVALEDIVGEGGLGKIMLVSTRRVGPFAPRIKDVGIVVDSATHDIGVIRHLLDQEPLSVFSRVGKLNHANEDHAIIVLSFPETTASLEVNWFTPHKVRTLVATGADGIAYLDYIEQKLTIHRCGLEQSIDVHKMEPLRAELESFVQHIKDGRGPAVDGLEGLRILEIALACKGHGVSALRSLQKTAA
jgi:UDP-N-acetylglucosamine 3-dehydrogenase